MARFSWLLLLLDLCLSILPTSMGFQTLSLKPASQRNGRLDNKNVIFLEGKRAGTPSTTFQTMKESKRRPGRKDMSIDMSLFKSSITTERVPAASDYAMGFSFSVAGLLFPYHLGVADYLKEKKLIIQGTPLSGSSGGALAAALTALSFSGLDIQDVLDTTQTAYTDLRLPLTSHESDITVHLIPCTNDSPCVDQTATCTCHRSPPHTASWVAPAQEFRQVCEGPPGPHAHDGARRAPPTGAPPHAATPPSRRRRAVTAHRAGA